MALSRRAFLKALGWSGAGIVVVAGAGTVLVGPPALPHRALPSRREAASWLSLRPDGSVEILSPRAEMGQGIATALRMLVAEETRIEYARTRLVQPRTDRIGPAPATVGSDSVKDYAPLLAQAAAALGLAIRRRAAQALAIPVERVRIDGDVLRADDGRTLVLAAVARDPLLVDAQSLADAVPRGLVFGATRTVLGTASEPDGIRAIVTGEAPLYADDVRLDGMAFGAMLRPPWLGARLVDVDDAVARELPGYLGLYRLGDDAALLARSQTALERAREQIVADWSGGADATQAAIEAAVNVDRVDSAEHVLVAGRIDALAPFDIDLRLEVPMAAHAAMEARCAVARFEDGRLEVWTGTQDPTFVARVLAREFGLRERDVVVYGQRLGGGFGGRTTATVERDAARLARASGRPVKVRWTREDEFRAGFHRPPSAHRISARLGPDGRIAAWRHRFRSGHVIFTSAALGPVLQAATSLVADPGVARGAVPPYALGSADIRFSDVRIPVRTGPWRGLGAAPNVWAIETAIDALARRAGTDPVAFRLAHLPAQQRRLARVLGRVAALARWPERRSDATRGWGVACGVYKENAYAAVVAEVVRTDGAPRVAHLYCAHDCGLLLDPDGVRAQIEGNLVWSMGTTLHERLDFVDGHVAQASFADYNLPRFRDVPPMTIALVDEGDPPTGAGETAIVAAPAAITNAIAAMTGRTVTRLPYRSVGA